MKIRTELVLACFLLSVLPLGGIVVYSYFASRRALESAYHAEATRLTAQMDRRLDNIRTTLQQRLAEVSALPELQTPAVMMAMGDAAPLIDSLEIQPFQHQPRLVMQHPHQPAANGQVAAPQPPVPPTVIEIPPMPPVHFTFSDEQRQLLNKITALASQLHEREAVLSQTERDELERELQSLQKEFDAETRVKQKQFDQELKKSLQVQREHVRERQREAVRKVRERQTALVLGKRFNVPLTQSGNVVGHIQAHVSADNVIRRVLGADEGGDRSEITFAVDRENNLYARSDEDRAALQKVGIPRRLNGIPNWIVVSRKDPESGLVIGVARPVGENLEQLRKTAAKNFGYGMALVFVALIGIVPIANHLTRDVQLVTHGAERVAHGDLTTRLPVRSGNEIGQLAAAFNRMAEDLSRQRETIAQQERAAVEYERKSAELEEARRFQLSMLPKEVPRHPKYDVAVFTHTAAEVGGDYYDFHLADDVMSVTIGDATGHGARAGTMVAVIKALFAGYDGAQTPAEFLRDATDKLRRMELGRMAMALQVARFDNGHVVLSSAGMPPAYLLRRDGAAPEEIARGATPLGTLGADYSDITVKLAPGDTMLFMSDGLPELQNATGQQFGYTAAADAFAAAARAEDADAVIAALSAAARNWNGDQPPNDDVTFVVVRARQA